MFARAVIKATKSAVLVNKKVFMSNNIIRSFSAHTVPSSINDTNPESVVIPELVDTLEWVLDSPPNVHQFEEPPIIVEIEHLKNLIVADH